MMNLLTLRFGEPEITELGVKDAATKLTQCGLEIERAPGGSLTATHRSCMGRHSALVIPGCFWTQRDKAMESCMLEGFRSLLSQLPSVAAGRRPKHFRPAWGIE